MTYRVETRTNEEHNRACCGDLYVGTTTVIIEAETKEEAIEKAKAEYDVVLEGSVISTEEFEKQKREQEEQIAKAKVQEEKAKAKRIERENQPGYKAKRDYKRAAAEIEKATEEIEALKRKVAYYEKKKIELAKRYEAETGEKI